MRQEVSEVGWYYPLLREGESVLWEGKPVKYSYPGRFFRGIFFLFWAGFAFYWEASVIISGAPLVMILFGLLFVGVGIYFLFYHFVLEPKLLRSQRYLITNQRVIIRKKGFRQQDITNLELDLISKTEIHKNRAGGGDIYFHSGGLQTSFSSNPKLFSAFSIISSSSGFFGLENVEEVAQILERAIAEVKKKRS